jgi:hypothetical protein
VSSKMLSVVIALCMSAGMNVCAQKNTQTADAPGLHVDIPTKLDKANVVVDLGHLVFGGDQPFALGDIHLLSNDLREWNATGQVIVIFHGDAAYLVLNDETYNATRRVTTGNPYKGLLNGLMRKGCNLSCAAPPQREIIGVTPTFFLG